MKKFVLFTLASEEYGIEIEKVREIDVKPEITPVPGSPDYISGITNLRGRIVVVLDLEKKLGISSPTSDEKRHIVITQSQDSNFGLLVSEVKEILSVDETKIQKTPELLAQKIDVSYILGVSIGENERIVILLNADEILKQKELESINQVMKEVAQEAH